MINEYDKAELDNCKELLDNLAKAWWESRSDEYNMWCSLDKNEKMIIRKKIFNKIYNITE